MFTDPDPVPPVLELRAIGALERTVQTQLVDEITNDLYEPS